MRYPRMRLGLVLVAGLIALQSAVAGATPTVWSGLDFAFTKANGADHTDPANQDAITSQVELTRAATQGLFNIAAESGYKATSPAGTEWAFLQNNPGQSEQDLVSTNWSLLNFADWTTALGGRGVLAGAILNGPGVLHLIDEDIYLDIQFTAWGLRGNGGFSYLRSVPEPGAGLLVGLAGFAALSRRR
ncbi:PEP-CTERM sorting domain-containing protein [Algisphaera agarilytica]|uniref:PEP-CTERM protein-sorting domain-containing protein n=1 Tax=Algisphaera agarilytica TaxID=1385975 RepID=A0A7X0H9E8_9BACT|nr:PEP-CTERM sorting domain-containing protein [Algisphaera agarilytica]MBB6430270.1 hypothetical protein [Algisphaera agarilytica]